MSRQIGSRPIPGISIIMPKRSWRRASSVEPEGVEPASEGVLPIKLRTYAARAKLCSAVRELAYEGMGVPSSPVLTVK